ncbi:hypothetical protein ACFQO9_19810 [Chryseobacterium zhengzhouense]|uniref:Uncharacterized protein n=1 Tax=Chryseobacterium zhengzhouense TaxID=1636086 RepID=A0ABW2M513_9FLAO
MWQRGDQEANITRIIENLHADQGLSIYGFASLLEKSKEEQGIAKDSIFDLIIADKESEESTKHIIEGLLIGVLAVALGLLTFGTGTVAVLLAAGNFALSAYLTYEEIDKYRTQLAAYKVDISEDEPSAVWVIIAVVGSILDAAAVAKISKTLVKAGRVFEETKDITQTQRLLAEAELDPATQEKITKALKENESIKNTTKEEITETKGKITEEKHKVTLSNEESLFSKYKNIFDKFNQLDSLKKEEFIEDFANKTSLLKQLEKEPHLIDTWTETVRSANIDELKFFKSKGPLREQYMEAVNKLKDEKSRLISEGKTKEEIARSLHQQRRDLGEKFKDATPDDLREWIYKFNEIKYEDKLGPKFNDLLIKSKAKGMTEEQAFDRIIESSATPLGNKKALGKAMKDVLGKDVIPILEKYRMLN